MMILYKCAGAYARRHQALARNENAHMFFVAISFHFDFLLCLIRYVGGIMGDDDSSLSERVESVAAVLGGALEQGELGT